MGNLNLNNIFFNLWAKYNKDSNTFHPLICHMIDSGNVFTTIWDEALTEPIKSHFCRLLELDENDTKNSLIFLSALHDMGKGSIAFQSSVPQMQNHLEQCGLEFPKRSYYSPQPHDLLTLWCLDEIFKSTGMFSGQDLKDICSVLGGHHGFFYPANKIISSHRSTNLGDEVWVKARNQIFETLLDIFKPPYKLYLHGKIEERQTALILLTGLIVVSDWLASDSNFFPYEDTNNFSLDEYFESSKNRSKKVLKITGWDAWHANGDQKDFYKLFNLYPNIVQKITIDSSEKIQPPFLAIIEAPTGQGKTEAALYLANHFIQSTSLRGLYIAMPTMATSNQMFVRVSNFLKVCYPHQLINLQLSHSQAQWNETFQSLKLTSVGDDIEEGEQGISALSWFFPKKKTLLAPFGVGTVDQAFMSVLKSNHFFLRLFGLSHKVIVFDEVHAYDVYMSTLFLRLLEWLKCMGCSVIILSATLTQKNKKEISQIYSQETRLLHGDYYPSLTIVDKAEIETTKIESVEKQHYHLEKIGQDLSQIVSFLNFKLSGGGCAAVVCNTVNRAQKVYRAIKESKIILNEKEETLLLFHARYPAFWRLEIEKRVLDIFGKNGNRPKKAILVATQVIEQSLDLDFDVMISDLAPIDLLIQRAGRLHRHKQHMRPGLLKAATLCICMPEQSKVIDFGNSRYVYDEDILLKTYYLLKDKQDLSLPNETRQTIEQVYDPNLKDWLTPDQLAQIQATSERINKQHQKEVLIAHEKLIPRAEDESILRLGYLHLEEDSPDIHQAFQALTRLSSPSITLICLLQGNNCLSTVDLSLSISLDKKPDSKEIEILLKSSLSVSSWPIIKHFKEYSSLPESWKKIAALSGCYPVIFHEGVYKIDEKSKIILDKEFGLQYVKEAK